jgi:hypothetical protein
MKLVVYGDFNCPDGYVFRGLGAFARLADVSGVAR